MFRVLVLGTTGMAGHMTALYLQENGYEVEGIARRDNAVIKGFVANITDFPKIREIVRNGNYDYVINCIGILNKEAEDNKASAVLINSYLPHFLTEITHDCKTRVIQVSTDCVFSGMRGGYLKNDLRDGEAFYDRTKALGEIEDSENTTLRCSIVGPDLEEDGQGLLNWFMMRRSPVNGYTGAIWTGQTTLQLAKTMDYVMKNRISGLYNAVPDFSISKYELLNLFNRYIRKDPIEIRPVEGKKLDKSLVATPLDSGYRIPGYDVMVMELADWMKKHRGLYSHYELQT